MEGMKFQENYKVTPSDVPNYGIMFVDHSIHGRSGHLGHALVQCANGDLLAFYPNCSDDGKGHSAVGWMEYKRSGDYGKTWGPPITYHYSREYFKMFGDTSVMAEKAVVTKNGTIVVFHLLCDISENPLWEPYKVPTYCMSYDNGVTWTKEEELDESKGRIYDAIYYDNEILVLKFCNDASISWTGSLPEHQYLLLASNDEGKSFQKRSILPFDVKNRGYGTICLLRNNELIAYCYNSCDEYHADYVLSRDFGRTWDKPKKAYFSKKIRNPQMISFGNGYLMHGRSGNEEPGAGNLIIYYSQDGIHWEYGCVLAKCEAGYGAYSNSMEVCAPDRKRLYIQSSHAYEENKTNILAWWIDAK